MAKLMPRIVSLIKITDYYQDVLAGDLFFHNIRFYKNCELAEIGDSTEATMAVRKYYSLIDENILTCPAFCMYHIESRYFRNSIQIKLDDERLKSFGKYAIVFTDVKGFISKVRANLPEFSCKLVRYINMQEPKGIDEYSIFNPIAVKSKYFKYQKEFRLYSNKWALADVMDSQIPGVTYIEENSKKFSIGDLSSFCKLYSTENLFSGVELDVNIDWDFCKRENFQITLPKVEWQ
jgi:hypothetical protein